MRLKSQAGALPPWRGPLAVPVRMGEYIMVQYHDALNGYLAEGKF